MSIVRLADTPNVDLESMQPLAQSADWHENSNGITSAPTNLVSTSSASRDILGNKAQTNAVMMPRRMSPQATSIRTQSIVAASDCEAIFL